MIIECHVILVKNLAESSDESFNENFIVFHFDFVIENCYNSTNQNFYSAAEFYSSFF